MEQPTEMADSEVANNAADESTSEAAANQAEDQAGAEVGAELDAEGNPIQPDQAESDEEEIDYEGEKFKVPKKLREAFLRQQDYTQKTQAVAEQRKALEAQAQEIQRQAQLQQENIAEYAEALSLDNQLKQYAQVDWNALMDADPVQAMKLDRQMREIQQRRDLVVATVTQKQQQAALQMQQETARRMQEGRAVLEREIKGWSIGNDLDMALDSYGKEFDIPVGLVVQFPKVGVLLHRAWQLDQLIKQQSAKEKPQPQEKPVTRVTTSKGTAVKDPTEMSASEFAAWRKQQIKNRNR